MILRANSAGIIAIITPAGFLKLTLPAVSVAFSQLSFKAIKRATRAAPPRCRFDIGRRVARAQRCHQAMHIDAILSTRRSSARAYEEADNEIAFSSAAVHRILGAAMQRSEATAALRLRTSRRADGHRPMRGFGAPHGPGRATTLSAHLIIGSRYARFSRRRPSLAHADDCL